MKPCILIPCFNHSATVGAIALAARAHGPVLVVDDGSTVPLPELPDCTVLRLERNGGKAAALRAGFWHAIELGFTHAITMDADGQHFAEDLPGFLALAAAQPEALLVGVRDFFAAGCPAHRRRSNAISTFWYRIETGVRLGDTQCGFRCYPLALVRRLKVRASRYAYELEFMVRAAWVGAPIVAVPVKCTYSPAISQMSHFRPVRDFLHITLMNIGLVLQSWFVPRSLRVAWSSGEHRGFRAAAREIFSDHAHDPLRLSLAVGLGLFFGIAPFWGFQMVLATALAHRLRLNKAIALLASNISIPPMVPLILGGSLALGHWMFTGRLLSFSPSHMTRAHVAEYFWQWLAGSFALAFLVAVSGTILTFIIARLVRRK
ncbi:MAG: DUF2062 domain-containing protein [Chthoniobacteraceae bacterium]